MQPRRIAARTLARFVARQRQTALGDEVGYQVRLEKVAGPQTRVLYETEGVLPRQYLADPQLSDIGIIVFDEFHERHLHADLMLSLALGLQAGSRPDLHVVVMSATLDTGSLQEYLAPCEHIVSAGRTYPVTVEYLDRPLLAIALCGKSRSGNWNGPGSNLPTEMSWCSCLASTRFARP